MLSILLEFILFVIFVTNCIVLKGNFRYENQIYRRSLPAKHGVRVFLFCAVLGGSFLLPCARWKIFCEIHCEARDSLFATTSNRRRSATPVTHVQNDGSMLQLDLRPTSALRTERFLGEEAETEQYPKEWFHPYSRAVYATLHPNDKEIESKNSVRNLEFRKEYQDFMDHRHLSRFEKQFRTKLGLDLHVGWKGNYSDPNNPFLEFHDDVSLWRAIVGSMNSTKTTATNYNRNRWKESKGNSTRSARSLLESLLGGKFDRYQGVPLSQGYGTHYVHLWVGTPIPQRQSVIVDTGSHFTGFPIARECRRCGESHHTDPHFDPEKSSSFRFLRCPEECVENHECETVPQGASSSTSWSVSSFRSHSTNRTRIESRPNHPRCKFVQAYTEGSSWTAYQARDIVYCGSGADLIQAVDPLDTKYAIQFLFGGLKENTGLFVTQLADGIMGMSAHELTLPKQLYNEGKIEYNMFAMCFRKELGTSKKGVTAGSMTIGGVSSILDTSPMVYARNIRPYGWYTVYIEKVYVATQGGTQFLFDDPNASPAEIQEKHRIIPMQSFDPTQVNRERGVIVDSGTTDTYISSSIRDEFVRIWKDVTGMEYSNGAVYLTQAQLKKLPTLLIQLQASRTATPPVSGRGSDTDKIDQKSLKDRKKSDPKGKEKQPPLSMASDERKDERNISNDHMARPVLGQVGYLDPNHWADVLLAVPATSYMEYSTTLKLYTSRLFFTESRGGVIGANSMQGHNVLFDWQHGRIGFAQSSCAYDLIAGKNDNHGDFSTPNWELEDDCMFVDEGKTPILTQTCLDSVLSSTTKMAICEASENPTNVEISGMEIWTLMVENVGKDLQNCQKRMQEWSESHDTINQIDPSVTNCTPEGLCHEHRPCHIPCMDVLGFKRKRSKNHGLRNEAVTIPYKVTERIPDGQSSLKFSAVKTVSTMCGNHQWSFCGPDCLQSRIESSRVIVHDNGNYCAGSNIETRSCHIDACGRSDPCIVPFLVHAIFVLEWERTTPGTPITWTPTIQEGFKSKLVNTIHNFASVRGKALFGPGDVNILVARGWYGDDDEENLEDDDHESTRIPHGVQLILQISISNLKAIQMKKPEQPNRGRSLLQEVGVVWSNITNIFRGNAGSSQCDPFDLYPLAKSSNLIADKILPSQEFLSALIAKKSNEKGRTRTNSDFDAFLDRLDSARLVSSWTIGTQIYDDAVNYLGPLAGTPLFPLIKMFHEAFILLVLFWLVMCLLKSIRLCRVCIVRVIKRWNPDSYQNDPFFEDDNDALIESVDGGDKSEGLGLEVELTTTNYLGARTRKRMNSMTTHNIEAH